MRTAAEEADFQAFVESSGMTEEEKERTRATQLLHDRFSKEKAEMVDQVARALGWRTDFAGSESGVTFDDVLDEVEKRTLALLTARRALK